MARTYCPSCDGEIIVGKPRLGAMVTCPECGETLEIINAQPLNVDYPYDDRWDEDNDWDDDWDDDWEEEEEELD
jgi:lysine biosynthesis protein LysW